VARRVQPAARQPAAVTRRPGARAQVDEEPAIRANTTILLGNLAPHLGEAACRRVLLNAFTRALKDSFPPARVAGLKARPRAPAETCFYR